MSELFRGNVPLIVDGQSVDILGDVDTTTTPPALNDALVWNGTQWVPGPVIASIGVIGTATDVDMTTTPPVLGDVMVYDGANWVPGQLDLDSLTDVDTTTTPPTLGQGLTWDGAAFIPTTLDTGESAVLEVAHILTPMSGGYGSLDQYGALPAPTGNIAVVQNTVPAMTLDRSSVGPGGAHLDAVVGTPAAGLTNLTFSRIGRFRSKYTLEFGAYFLSTLGGGDSELNVSIGWFSSTNITLEVSPGETTWRFREGLGSPTRVDTGIAINAAKEWRIVCEPGVSLELEQRDADTQNAWASAATIAAPAALATNPDGFVSIQAGANVTTTISNLIRFTPNFIYSEEA